MEVGAMTHYILKDDGASGTAIIYIFGTVSAEGRVDRRDRAFVTRPKRDK
jgi:hypothetical protein